MTDLFAYAADLLDPLPNPFYDDPVAWAEVALPTLELAEYQCEVLTALPRKKRVAVRAPHGTGKTTTQAVAVLWFAQTRSAANRDWKCPTTASVWRQLIQYLWPEIHKWQGRMDWDALGIRPWTRYEMLALKLKLRAGEAFAVASSDPAKMEGAHADELLYLFDEAKIIPPATFDAAEGAFSGAGEETGNVALALATSTPGEPNGRFYDIHARRAGLEGWHTIHITLDRAIAAGRIAREWAEDRARQWGVDSAVFQNRVLGEFASSEEEGVIPLSSVERANERWLARQLDDVEATAVGVDVARSGTDRTVLATLGDGAVLELRDYVLEDTAMTTGRARGILDRYPNCTAVVDVIGIGAGVVDHLREDRLYRDRVVAFNAAEGTDRRDKSGELGFINKRAAGWWNLRELLEDDLLDLPPHDQLTGELTAPHWRVTSGGRIAVESKDEIRKRLGRSTDFADSVMQACWGESDPNAGLAGLVPGGGPGGSGWRRE